jgi:hypothetical protein
MIGESSTMMAEGMVCFELSRPLSTGVELTVRPLKIS